MELFFSSRIQLFCSISYKFHHCDPNVLFHISKSMLYVTNLFNFYKKALCSHIFHFLLRFSLLESHWENVLNYTPFLSIQNYFESKDVITPPHIFVL